MRTILASFFVLVIALATSTQPTMFYQQDSRTSTRDCCRCGSPAVEEVNGDPYCLSCSPYTTGQY